MPISLIQQQQQVAVQQQRLAAYQLLQVKLLSMPLTQLEEAVRMEIDDNPALETLSSDTAPNDEIAENGNNEPTNNDLRADSDDDNSFEKVAEREERADELNNALNNIGLDDRLPDFNESNTTAYAADYEEMVFGNTTSFYDKLREQMGEISLSPEQEEIVEYLIGSLDDDGLLRKESADIADELAIYHNIDVDETVIEEMINVVQSFDPPGIGARSLQECLLLQIDRKIDNLQQEHKEDYPVFKTLELLHDIIKNNFQLFKLKQWAKIANIMHLDETDVANILHEIKRLNPRPGAALGETIGRSLQQITPDFIIDSDDNGNISVSLNKGNLPTLVVSPSFSDMVKKYQTQKRNMSKSEREAYKYALEKVDTAQTFIDAITIRRKNMLVTMRTIAALQHDYFLSGDENDLKPMILKDVAERSGLNISTISRVTNQKYVQTRWGIIALRMLFSERSIETRDGMVMSKNKVLQTMKDIIDNEDKHKPISDESLRTKMIERGFPIARRTIAKYREQLGIPIARLRKEF